MYTGFRTCIMLVAAFAVTASAQTFQRRSTFLNGARPGEGRCVVEVVVDGAAEVEIRGDNASLRNLKGQPPQWRRFECTGPVPVNPGGFRFRGIDGRGSQVLMQPAQNGAPAVVRIEDPANGSEGYTFEITWGGPPEVTRGGPPMPVPPPPDRDRGGFRFGTDDAVRVCQDNVRDQAARRFNAGDIIFRRTRMDDQPGRNDWVTGFFEARSRSGQPRLFQFSCSVNFDNGVVRSANIQPARPGAAIFGDFGDQGTGRAIQACEASVEQRIIRDGFRRVDFASARPDDRPGRNDFVIGTASALDRDRPVWFDFACGVNLRDGDVRSVDVTPRR